MADTGALLWRLEAADGEGTVTVLVPPGSDAEGVTEHIRRDHPSLDLTTIVTRSLNRTFLTRRSFQHSLEEWLTERQWEVLRLACEGATSSARERRPRATSRRSWASVRRR